MTEIDYFAIVTKTLGLQYNIRLSRPPYDCRFGDDGKFSLDTTNGRYRSTVKIEVGGATVADMRGLLKQLVETKQKNGGGDFLTILEETARQAVADITAAEVDEDCELDEEERAERLERLRSEPRTFWIDSAPFVKENTPEEERPESEPTPDPVADTIKSDSKTADAPDPAADDDRPELKPDRDQAERHLTALDPSTDRFTFQTFDDSKEHKKARAEANKLRKQQGKGRLRDPFAHIFHGTLAKHWDKLVELNNKGAGIFICVNVTDFKGREIKNIKRVRAGFNDLDGAPLERVLAPGEPKAHIIVESSLARFHSYYIVGDDMPLDQFEPLQRAIAAHFGGDPSVHDLPRVMRLAGFVHRKGEPFLSRLVQTSDHEPYGWNELCKAFPPTNDSGERLNLTRKSAGVAEDPTATPAYVFLDPKSAAALEQRYGRIDAPFTPQDFGEDIPGRPGQDLSEQWKKLNSKALRRLADWVPDIFPTASSTSKGGYRVSSVDLGRDLEEDLSFHPEGIKDFGVHDLGDPRAGKRTPIDIVEQYLHKDFNDALRWLAQKLGLDPNNYLPNRPAPTEQAPDYAPVSTNQNDGTAFGYSWQLIWHGETDPTDARKALVQDLLPETGVAFISGQWGTYKTFVAIDLAAAVMTATPFANREVVRKGGVLFLACEGHNEVDIRLTAAFEKRGGIGNAPFVWIKGCPRLLDKNAAKILAAIVKHAATKMMQDFNLPIVMIIIDTAGKAASLSKPGDLNDDAVAKIIMSALAEAATQTNALFVGVAHFGKNVEVGTKGSTGFEDDSDVVLALLGERGINGVVNNPTLCARKRKSGPNGEEFSFQTEPADVGPEKTLTIRWTDAPTAKPKKKDDPWAAKTLRHLKATMTNMLADCGSDQRPYPDGPLVRAVDIEIVRAEFYKSYPATGDENAKKDIRRKAFNRAIGSADDKHLIGTRDIGTTTFIWFAQEDK